MFASRALAPTLRFHPALISILKCETVPPVLLQALRKRDPEAKGGRRARPPFARWPRRRRKSSGEVGRSCDRRFDRRGGSSSLSAFTSRQPHREYRALAPLARHGHIAAHHARELAGDGKPEPSAAELLRGRGIGLAELLEQLCLLLRRHADSGVRDGELDEAAAIAHLACCQLDLAHFGELARITEEIEQNLLEPHGVRGERAQVL